MSCQEVDRDLSWVQVSATFVVNFPDVQWPQAFKDIASFFRCVNFDFVSLNFLPGMQSNFASETMVCGR